MDLVFRILSNVDIGDLMSHMVCDFGLAKFQLTCMSSCKSLCSDPSGYLVFITDSSTKGMIRKVLTHVQFLSDLMVHYSFPLFQASESIIHSFCLTTGFSGWLHSPGYWPCWALPNSLYNITFVEPRPPTRL